DAMFRAHERDAEDRRAARQHAGRTRSAGLASRRQRERKLSGPERDLVILGGGVTGLGIARLAARAGWSVTVVERDDLATGASSATSHMRSEEHTSELQSR